ncbi:MAG: type II toxin-antitoxin system RelE/ParE family toxin [Elusimicrobiota bacterium]|nr:type II toxin-antitoxin system RelE/ParE family toxin [Elusimicrobiota bacterium]
MKYTLVYTARAVRDIETLDTLVKKRIAEKIIQLKKSPLKKAKKLIHSKIGSYRYRIGDYRIVFDLDGKDIVILRVGHRREIYR